MRLLFDLTLLLALGALLWVTLRHWLLTRKPHPSLEDAARTFLGSRRIAFVGLSTRPDHFSRMVLTELLARGYEVVPVHPEATEVAGLKAHASLRDIPEPVEGALVMTPAWASVFVVRDCIASGVTRVWLHRGVGKGAVTEAAVELAHQAGMTVVEGACPMMYLAHSEWPHRLHGWARNLSTATAS